MYSKTNLEQYGEQELPAKDFDDQQATDLVREFVRLNDDTAKESVQIAIKIRDLSNYHLLPQSALNVHATAADIAAQAKAIRKTNRPGDSHSTWTLFTADAYGSDRGSNIALRTYLQHETEGSHLKSNGGMANPPPNAFRNPMLMSKWHYEVTRQLIVELGWLFAEIKRNGSQEALDRVMGVGDKFTYRCSAHPSGPRQCSAEDYMAHMLDQARDILADTNLFPVEANTVSDRGRRACFDIVRRIYRVFPYCLWHQRKVFLDFEQRRHLYTRFLVFNERCGFVDRKHLQPFISENQMRKLLSS